MEQFYRLILAFSFSFLLTINNISAALANGNSTTSPTIPSLVNGTFFVDTTGTIPQDILDQANAKAQIANSKGYQIGGWFFNNTPSTMEQISTKFGNQNRLGFAGKDIGIAISIALDRKGKDGKAPAIFIATGKGMGGILNDAKVGRIKREFFDINKTGKDQDWQQGFLRTIDALEFEVKEGFAQVDKTDTGFKEFLTIFFLLMLIILVILIVLMFIDNSNNGGGGRKSNSKRTSNYSSGSSLGSYTSDSSSSSSSGSDWGSGGGGGFDGGGGGD